MMTMRWSAARSRFEALLAPAVAGHVRLYATRYRGAHDFEGRGWITWDGEQIASFETLPYLVRIDGLAYELKNIGQTVDEAWDRALATANREGRFALWQFIDAVETYPSLAVDDAVSSQDAIIRSLAMLDRRLGKRRLSGLVLPRDEQQFVRRLHALRCAAEGVRLIA